MDSEKLMMWSKNDDVILAAVTYYIKNKISCKIRTAFEVNTPSDAPHFRLADGDKYLLKCGQIILTAKNILVLRCIFCKKKYESTSNFMQHLKLKHMPGQDESQMAGTSATAGIKIASDDEVNTDEEVDMKSISRGNSSPSSSLTFPLVYEEIRDDSMLSENDVKSETESEKENDKASIISMKVKKPIKKRKPYKKRKKIKTVLKCDKCEKVFTNKANLRIHSVCHSTVRSYSCNVCERTFKHKCNLNQHVLRHTNEKKYKCEQCDKPFFTHIEVVRHQRWHSADRAHVCLKCGDAFKSDSNLVQHIKRVHDNIRTAKCDICEMSFFDNTQLKMHIVIHSNERPFACSYCSARFKRRSHLTQHTKMHMNAREYICHLCNKSFNLKPALNSHIKNIHKVLDYSPIIE